MKDKPNHLIKKFLRDELSLEEGRELKEWLETPGGREFLKKEIQLYHILRASFHRFDAGKAYARAYPALRKTGGNRFSFRTFLRYAAILVVVLGCGYFLYTNLSSNTEELVIPDEKITLQLEDGTIQTILPGEEQEIMGKDSRSVSLQKGDTLYYDTGNRQGEMAFNILHVPYGKTFKLRLSDGTVVHLNAGTRLRYPVWFGKDAREVFLKGEAYFKVRGSTGSPFLIHAANMDIEVTGTEFNVSAYDDDVETSVVLAEGIVELYGGGPSNMSGEAVTLSPGQMGTLDRFTSQFSLREVEARDHTAWMDGKVIFYNKAFEDVLKILERKYNVTIQNNYTELNEGRYKATFDDETIEQVLQTFTESRLFSYQIRNNVIVIDKPAE